MKTIFLLKENKKTIERHIVRIPEFHEEWLEEKEATRDRVSNPALSNEA